MKKAEFTRRFLFVPVICAVMLVLLILYRVILTTGFFEIDFTVLDDKIIPERFEMLEISNEKHPDIPETKNEGSGDVDINNASISELDRLPQIGEKRARAIVRQRDIMGGFTNLKDLLCTNGIGMEIFKEIEPYIRITEYTRND